MEDFAAHGPLVRLVLPPIRFLFVGSRVCSTLPSDGPSRDLICPCASLALRLHQAVQGTFTPKLLNMPDTPCRRLLRLNPTVLIRAIPSVPGYSLDSGNLWFLSQSHRTAQGNSEEVRGRNRRAACLCRSRNPTVLLRAIPRSSMTSTPAS